MRHDDRLVALHESRLREGDVEIPVPVEVRDARPLRQRERIDPPASFSPATNTKKVASPLIAAESSGCRGPRPCPREAGDRSREERRCPRARARSQCARSPRRRCGSRRVEAQGAAHQARDQVDLVASSEAEQHVGALRIDLAQKRGTRTVAVKEAPFEALGDPGLELLSRSESTITTSWPAARERLAVAMERELAPTKATRTGSVSRVKVTRPVQ